MGKTFIIAEKPSVASDIAKALGGFSKHDDYYENDQYFLSSAVGHLLEICVPEEYEVKRGKWTFSHLPVIPPHFDLRPLEKTEPRLKVLARLAKRKDVNEFINACDAGREGELIFQYLVQYLQSKKPVKRLWLQSMTPQAIRDGFSHLRDGAAMRPLGDAAVCRSEADWLVGINGTRAMTAFNSKSGGFHLTTVGRVQTPTLALVVEREERIKHFKPKDYWEVFATFASPGGDYSGRWFNERADKTAQEADLKPERIWDLKEAEKIRHQCLGKGAQVTEDSKPVTESCPTLYDLTSLQREANSRFGFSAKTTLSIAQALYEKHKVITYPRTDARALPEDYVDTVKETCAAFRSTPYASFAETILNKNWARPNKRIFNNAKVSDHFAIIPTSLLPKNLTEAEEKLYDLITKRFLAVFFPGAEYRVTTRISRISEHAFKSEGKVLVGVGWLIVYGKQSQNDSPHLPALDQNASVTAKEVEIVPGQTKPPARFTEATLLTAMESAGKTVEDEELREALRAKGLGTPATRATIIENLISEKYLLRSGRELQPTAKAFSLITLLRGLDIRALCSAELTGNWEYKLKQMESGQMKREEFMREIEKMTRAMVENAKKHENDTVPGDFVILASPCPKCGGVVRENYKKFQCQNCDFSVWKIVAGRQFEIDEAEALMSKRSIGPLQGFRSRAGRPFAAIIRLSPSYELEFDFGNNDASGVAGGGAIDFSGLKSLGKCPACGAGVYEQGMRYVCERAVGPGRACSFNTSKIILQRSMEPEQIVKLLNNRKTDLLHRFISKKGRPFSAYLVVTPEGKVGFEFEPRQPKSGPRSAARKPRPTKAG